jgi:hypothetical protein
MSNISRNPTDLVKSIGTYRPTAPFAYFWEIVWQESGLFWVVAPLFLWLLVGCTCAVALIFQKVVWISRFAGVGTGESGHNLHSLPSVLNPSSIWFSALISSAANVSYYFIVATLWANTDTAFHDIRVFILQICAATLQGIFVAVTTFKSSISLIECMNYRDSSHQAPEPPEFERPKKHPTQKEVETKRSLWKEDAGSTALASGTLTLTTPVFGSNKNESHSVNIVQNTATKREKVRKYV